MPPRATKNTEIQTLGVVGAGQMGRGIAQVAASAGIGVVLIDSTPQLAEQAVARVTADLDKLVARQKIPAAERAAVAARLHAGQGMADLRDVDFVVEAATESLAIKQGIFTDLDKACRTDAILASNTSSISITELSACTRRADRVIGMHFMNPVPTMELVEIVRGVPTSDGTYDVTRDLAERLGKITVVSRDVPGFIVNRVLMPLINEAIFALSEGLATREDIDKAIHLGLKHPMGPLALADLIGLDTTLSILEFMHQRLGEKYRPCPLLREHVAAGRLGRKSGRGFYEYSPRT
jgi:3-hydroxybutyryl-CoA dehydrogenase